MVILWKQDYSIYQRCSNPSDFFLCCCIKITKFYVFYSTSLKSEDFKMINTTFNHSHAGGFLHTFTWKIDKRNMYCYFWDLSVGRLWGKNTIYTSFTFKMFFQFRYPFTQKNYVTSSKHVLAEEEMSLKKIPNHIFIVKKPWLLKIGSKFAKFVATSKKFDLGFHCMHYKV